MMVVSMVVSVLVVATLGMVTDSDTDSFIKEYKTSPIA